MWFLWLVCLLRTVSGEPIVEIQDGRIEGEMLMTVRGAMPYSSFRSIPYAQPPVGPLRFKRPLPAVPWNGTLDARHDATMCIQALTELTMMGDEDCLYLNVYTPKTNFSNPDDEKMAVMVLIHGGGFTVGSGNRHWYGPDYFMEEDVVMVTLNYRVGVFGFGICTESLYKWSKLPPPQCNCGAPIQSISVRMQEKGNIGSPSVDRHIRCFLSFLTEEFPGNLGLWDQAAALRWVKNNIAVFGGDPSKVTIMGESAGAASVHAHILSNVSQDLFHKAISQSGTMMSPWAMRREPLQRSNKLAEAVKCFSPDMASMEKCLMEVSAEKLVKAAAAEVFSPEDFTNMDVFQFIPVMDGDIRGIEPFFTKRPEELMKAGNFKKVPYICGINSNEMLVFFIDPRLNFPTQASKSQREGLFLILNDVITSHDLPKISHIDDIMKFSVTQQERILKSIALIIKSASDLAFRFPASRTMELQSEYSSPQFLYEFGFDGGLGEVKRRVIEPIRQIPGVPHVEDIFYMFFTNFSHTLPEIDPAMITLYRMVRMWTNFAKFSDPTPDPLDTLLGVHWDTYSNTEKRFLAIRKELTVRCDLTVNDRCGLPTLPESTVTRGEVKEEDLVLDLLYVVWLLLAGFLAVVSVYFGVRFLCLRCSHWRLWYRRF